MSTLVETMGNGVYCCRDGENVLLEITDIGDNIYHAHNLDCDIVAEIVPVDDYITRMTCISHKRRGRDGRFRKTTKLMQHSLFWLSYMLEEKGFIRKSKPTKGGTTA